LLAGMRTGYPQTEETGAAIALYLAVCMLVCGLFGFGFYSMLQPRQIPNPGLAAYKPPPAAVIRYAAAGQLAYRGSAPAESASEDASHDTPDETTGRAAQVAETPTPVVSMPAPQVNSERRPARAREAAKSHQARSARAERSASSRAQTGYRGVVAAYPGYAVIH